MLKDDGFDIIIISDLHMSAGRDANATFDRNEDFFYDDALDRFLEHVSSRACRKQRRLRLVILGDFVDFLQVDPEDHKARRHSSRRLGQGDFLDEPKVEYKIGDTSSDSTTFKLEIIAGGHEGVFKALARFLGEGHQLDIVLGNHDVEFIWPKVQKRFKELVFEHTDRSNPHSGTITFHPWIFYVPGVVYAEHGHQYDALNSFENQLEPFLPSEKEIELPLGSFFVLYLFNKIEQYHPFADNMKPPTRYIKWALFNRPRVLLRFPRFFYEGFKEMVLPIGAKRTREVNLKLLGDYATKKIKLTKADTIVEIYKNIARPATARDRLRQLAILLWVIPVAGRPVVAAGFAIGWSMDWILFAIGRAIDRVRQQSPRERSSREYKEEFKEAGVESYKHLIEAAQGIHDLFKKNEEAVPVAYVFGHTHEAEQYILNDKEDAPRYINSGTWTPIIPDPLDLLANRELFPFVEVAWDPRQPSRVAPKLLLWNDDAERIEPLTRIRDLNHPSDGPRRSSLWELTKEVVAWIVALIIFCAFLASVVLGVLSWL